MKINKYLLIAASICCYSFSAFAATGTAANTKIINTITVYYSDSVGTNNYEAEASAEFIVNLVPAAPHVVLLVDDTTQTTQENTTVSTRYIITATANGEDDYTFTVGGTDIIANSANLTDVVVSTIVLSNTGGILLNNVLTLGATSLVEDLNTASTTLLVPWDGSTTPNTVNGLAVDDTIELSGKPYVIGAIDNSATFTNNNHVQITLTTAYYINDGAIAAGTIVGEQATLTITFETGTLSGSNINSEYYTLTPGVSYNDGSSDIALSSVDFATITVVKPIISINKYVRNITDSSKTGSTATADQAALSDATYYRTGVTGKPSDVMEYLIVIENSDTDADFVSVADVIPQFTTLDASSVKIIPSTTAALNTISSTSGWTDVVLGTGVAKIVQVSGRDTLCVFAGTGGDINGSNPNVNANNPCTGKGGTLLNGNKSLILFRTDIQ